MELLHEPRTARKIELLKKTQKEVLVLTSRRFLDSWPEDLIQALSDCCRRGVEVKALVEGKRIPWAPPARKALRKFGARLRWVPRRFLSALRTMPVQGEIWIFDREELITSNQRSRKPRSASNDFLSVECRLGPAAAKGAAAYFDQQWEARKPAVEYSVRHKQFAFHSGDKAEQEFFSCLSGARRKITICLPSGRVTRRLAQSLYSALQDGVHVTIYANADRDSTIAVKRLRRLALNGATVKICGGRLRSECALVDDRWVFVGSIPRSWGPWLSPPCPAFLVSHSGFREEILEALESQVSVEFNSPLLPHSGL